MCRNRICNVATLRIVLMTIAIAYTNADSKLTDLHSKPDTLASNSDENTQNVWPEDPPRGNCPEVYGIPLVLFHPAYLGMYEPTNPLLPQDPHAHPNMDYGTINQDFDDYARRSANEVSPAEKEYQAVRRALARDRVQPLRRSMAPATRVEPQISRKRSEKTAQDLSPLIARLENLVDKLDSGNGGVARKADDGTRRGYKGESATLTGTDNRNFGQKAEEGETDCEQCRSLHTDYGRHRTEKESLKEINPLDSRTHDHRVQPMRRSMEPAMRSEKKIEDFSPLVARLENLVDKLDSRNGEVAADSRQAANDSRPETNHGSLVQEVNHNRIHRRKARTVGEPTSSMATGQKKNLEVHQSAFPVLHSLAENSDVKRSSEFLENSSGF